MQSIQDTIAESPHKYNHIYHVLDAADFPLSLLPDLYRRLSLAPQRSRNRRSRTSRFYGNKKTEISFVITRSDLFAPKKEQVDSLMPYLLRTLRDALGPAGEDIRLGNVRCVSSKRGWWTREIKEQIWARGGGGWMVGKVNVGKSNLFDTVFPKSGNVRVKFQHLRPIAELTQSKVDELDDVDMEEVEQDSPTQLDAALEALDESSLLPPRQQEMPFPIMPIISSLPGTTASPIRHSFGNGRGELVDLPGLPRGNLDTYVRPEHHLDLVMRERPRVEQHVLKPGKSLLLGGLFRITPTSPDTIILAYPFVPVEAHLTSEEKAATIHTQQRESGVQTITRPGVGEKMMSAGTFSLKWDVTKLRSGPLTNASAVGLKVDQLPYQILSTDILIEGVGWVELVAQVRKKAFERMSSKPSDSDHEMVADKDDEPMSGEAFPEVEVFSPGGKYVGQRRPMNAWLLANEQTKPASKLKGRPRPSMKNKKKIAKVARRSA